MKTNGFLVSKNLEVVLRRGGRAVECGGLENRFSRNRNGGSNPSPSATTFRKFLKWTVS
jgi:hypothetical protein